MRIEDVTNQMLVIIIVAFISVFILPHNMENKGHKVDVNTFNKWGSAVKAHIGFNTEETDGRKYVNFVWCRLCAGYKDKLVAHPNLRGAAKKAIDSYAIGTNTVTKSNILRHLEGKAHTLALMLDSQVQHSQSSNSEPEPDVTEHTSVCNRRQPHIDYVLDKASREAYFKLMKTAYELAVHAMPFHDFEVLVKVQKNNGVELIQGKDNSRAAREMVNCLGQAVREKLAVILTSKKVFSSLSDGSQARKTGADKELIFVRLERGGLPIYYCLGLEDLSEHGGANAAGIKGAHDKVFQLIDEKIYTEGMVSCTADGAAVNFGRCGGFLTKMKDTRPWLLQLHCVNHKAELAAKSVFENTHQFKDIDQLYMGIQNLLKNSGRLKSEVRNACHSLDMTYYSLQKIHGTRFQHQRRKGFKRFLHMWIPLANTFENALCQPSNNYTTDTRAKMDGYLKKLRRFDMLVNLSLYYDILESVGVLSLVFEKKSILVCEVGPARDKAISNLYTLLEMTVTEDSATKHFSLMSNAEGVYHVEKQVPKEGEERKNPANKSYTNIAMNVSHVSNINIKLLELKKRVIEELKNKYISRFQCFEDPVVKSMLFIDPKYWDETDKNFGNQDILQLAEFFNVPLDLEGFDSDKVISEWQGFKRLVCKYYSKHPVGALWRKIFEFRFLEFPNLCKLVSLILSVSVSNSTVERGFSALTLILSDRRLSMLHKNLEAMMMVKINDQSWTPSEREEIINKAVEIYLGKRRVKRIEQTKSISHGLSDVHVDSSDSQTEDIDLLESDSESEGSYVVSDCDTAEESEDSYESDDKIEYM